MELIERIHNTITGEITERPFTDEEIAEVLKERAKLKAAKVAAETAAAEAAAAKAALLEKLGITEEEAKLLLS